MERFVQRETVHHLQSTKIRQLGEALIATGYLHLDEQARVLGLSRSTTWTILRAKHKTSGLSASVIKRMLRQPQLPALVRKTIFEYVDEKSAGVYGHNSMQVRRFVAALSPMITSTASMGSPLPASLESLNPVHPI
jgi:predicted DNA-binding transcriptional regulator AlpA